MNGKRRIIAIAVLVPVLLTGAKACDGGAGSNTRSRHYPCGRPNGDPNRYEYTVIVPRTAEHPSRVFIVCGQKQGHRYAAEHPDHIVKRTA